MSQLSAQSIRRLCVVNEQREKLYGARPMIWPFSPERQVINGKSAGLSACSYDIRIKDTLVLGPNPGYVVSRALQDCPVASGAPHTLDDALVSLALLQGFLRGMKRRLSDTPPAHALGVSLEHFVMPHNVSGYVCDKSTYARLHVTAFNTLFDPGFIGHATLEIVNLSDKEVVIEAGDPICQLVFHWLDEVTERPYVGKFQGQPARPVGPRLEQPDGSYVELYHDDKV